MHIEFDEQKNRRNIQERGLPFNLAREFDFASAFLHIDSRMFYGETRYVALGTLRGRLHVLCFTEVAAGIRVISFRKANSREVKHYEQQNATD